MAHLFSPFDVARARAREAGAEGDWPQAARWAERAWRLSGRRPLAALEFAAALSQSGDHRAADLLAEAARHHPDFPVLLALAAAQRRGGDLAAARATLHRLLTSVAVDVVPPAAALATEIAASAGLDGWLGWRNGRLLFGAAAGAPETLIFTADRRTLALEWSPAAPQLWSAPMPPGARGILRASAPLLGAPLDPERFGRPEARIVQSGPRVHGWVWFPHDPGRRPGLSITLAGRGRRVEMAIEEMALLPPTEAEPFARRWGFDLTIPAGASVVEARDIPSGFPIPLPSGPGETRADTLPRPDLPRRNEDRSRERVLLVTHDEGGGIERHVQRRLAALRRAGKTGLLLRSQRDQPGTVRLGDVTFRLPAEGAALLHLLRAQAPARIEFHQPRRHDDLVWQLAASLSLPYDVYLHDYALLCPRATLIGADGTYCGEPPVAQCERCLQSFEPGHALAPAGVAALRRRSAELLGGAGRVHAPSADVARRFRRHMPDIAIAVRPWEAATPTPGAAPAPGHARVLVVGALNEHKGFGILLDCARDAAIRDLPIRFTVVGHTIDDGALIGAGVFVTGPYLEAERADLIARQQGTLGFLPSIWPEPWCYSLTGLLAAGLRTLCFDIGAQAGRVRAAGGDVLPLGTTAAEINQHFMYINLNE